MISDYLMAAMRQASYEFLPNDRVYYGEIKGFEGVYASSLIWKIAARNFYQCSKTGYFTASI